jgi:hypothetical protein
VEVEVHLSQDVGVELDLFLIEHIISSHLLLAWAQDKHRINLRTICCGATGAGHSAFDRCGRLEPNFAGARRVRIEFELGHGSQPLAHIDEEHSIRALRVCIRNAKFPILDVSPLIPHVDQAGVDAQVHGSGSRHRLPGRPDDSRNQRHTSAHGDLDRLWITLLGNIYR